MTSDRGLLASLDTVRATPLGALRRSPQLSAVRRRIVGREGAVKAVEVAAFNSSI